MKIWKETIKPIFIEAVAALVVGSVGIVIAALAVKIVSLLFQ